MPDIEDQPMPPEPEGAPEGLSTAALAGAAQPKPAEPRSFAAEAGKGERPNPLLPENEIGQMRERWTDIQAGFVDEPRRAVQQADELVAKTMKRLAETFAHERASLEGQWDRGDQVGTEELRVALQRYRSFFDRLLAV